MQHPISFNNVSQPNLSLLSNSIPFPYNLNPAQLNALSLNQSLCSIPNQDMMQRNMLNNLMMWKLHTDMQNQVLNARMAQLLELQAETKKLMKENPTGAAMNFYGTSDLSKNLKMFSAEPTLPQLCDENKSVKAHLKDIIYFVLNNFGILDEEGMKAEKLKYRNNQELSAVFEALITKYTSTIKSREEIMKYTFRKSVKFMKQNVKNEMKKGATSDYGSDTSLKRHFTTFLNEMSEKIEDGLDDEDSASASKSLMPVMQNAAAANNISPEMISEAFSSEEFRIGFHQYVQTLERSLEFDNNKKIDKFVKFIEGAMKKNSIKDIKKFKRIPWLKTWVESTKRVAVELLSNNKPSDALRGVSKMVKKEEVLSSSYEECSDETYSLKLESHSESF